MSDISKKSLLISVLVALICLGTLIWPVYFSYMVMAMGVVVILSWKIFFSVSFSRSVLSQKFKFLILPMVFNLGALYLTTIFFQTFAKAIISILLILTNYFLWIALKKVHNLSDRAAIFHRNILIVISFVSVFLGSMTVFRMYMLFNTTTNMAYGQLLLVLSIFILFYLVSSFLTWENGAHEDVVKLRPYNIVNSLLGAEIAWISSLWIVNYPVMIASYKANLGATPLPAILLTITFYFLWGIIFHKLDGSLTRRVLTEYIFITFIFLAVLLVTARWLPAL